MALPASGAISFGDIATEWAQSASNVALSALYKEPGGSIVLAVDTAPNVPTVPGNAISLDNFHSASKTVLTTVTGYPSANTQVSGSWANPTNAYSVNGSYTSITAPADGSSYQLQLDNFGFDALIPSGKTIAAVRIHVKSACGPSGQILWSALQFYTTGGTVGVERQPWVGSTTLTELSWNLPARGTSWSRSELLDGTFYCTTDAGGEIDFISKQYRLDCVWVEVDYVP